MLFQTTRGIWPKNVPLLWDLTVKVEQRLNIWWFLIGKPTEGRLPSTGVIHFKSHVDILLYTQWRFNDGIGSHAPEFELAPGCPQFLYARPITCHMLRGQLLHKSCKWTTVQLFLAYILSLCSPHLCWPQNRPTHILSDRNVTAYTNRNTARQSDLPTSPAKRPVVKHHYVVINHGGPPTTEAASTVVRLVCQRNEANGQCTLIDRHWPLYHRVAGVASRDVPSAMMCGFCLPPQPYWFASNENKLSRYFVFLSPVSMARLGRAERCGRRRVRKLFSASSDGRRRNITRSGSVHTARVHEPFWQKVL